MATKKEIKTEQVADALINAFEAGAASGAEAVADDVVKVVGVETFGAAEAAGEQEAEIIEVEGEFDPSEFVPYTGDLPADVEGVLPEVVEPEVAVEDQHYLLEARTSWAEAFMSSGAFTTDLEKAKAWVGDSQNRRITTLRSLE